MRHLSQYTPLSFFSFDTARLYYEVSGSAQHAPTLVFIHGLGGDLTAWDKEREYFSEKGYATIALDLRGHGFSERGKSEKFYEMDNFAKDILMLIEIEKLQNFVIIGHCFGGIVSLLLQGKYKTHAKGLILIDTGYKPPYFSEFIADSVLLRKITSLVAINAPPVGTPGHADYDKYINTGDFNVKRIYSDIMHTTLQSYLLACSNLLSFDGETLLSHIKLPTLVIEGEKDSVFPLEMAKVLHERIIHSELEIIPGANHILVLNNPAELSYAVEKFLKKLTLRMKIYTTSNQSMGVISSGSPL